MTEFDIQYEDMGFTDSPEADGHSLSGAQLEALNLRASAEGWFPPNIKGVTEAYVTEDDNQAKTDKKVFVCVKLRTALDASADPDAAAPPLQVLDKVVSELLSAGRSTPLPVALENAWENVDSTAVESPAAPARRRAKP